MTNNYSLPPLRDLSPGRIAQRAEHLHAEITRQHPSRRLHRLAVLVIAAAVVVAVPAVAIAVDPGVLPWNGQAPAPANVVQNFASLAVGAPPGMNPYVQASQARSVTLANGSTLWIAPAANNGICLQFQNGDGGCDQGHRRTIGVSFGITGLGSGLPINELTIRLEGTINAPAGSTLEADFANGTTVPIPLVWVGPPISAGFYQQTIPPGPKITALVLRNPSGDEIATRAKPFADQLYSPSGPASIVGSTIDPVTGTPRDADASQAQVLITSGNAILSTAPRSNGNGQCAWINIGNNGGGYSDCQLPLPSVPELGLFQLDNGTVLAGQVGSDVTSVTLQLANGTTTALTPTQGWILLAGLTTSQEPITAIAYNASGGQVATQTLGN